MPEYEKLIYSQAHKFPTTTITSFDDYVQEGNVAILKCLKRYDDTKNTKFSSYAFPAIFREINNKQYQKFKRPSSLLDDEDCLVEEKDGELWEILPKDISEIEFKCVDLLHKKYKIKDIAAELKIRPIEVKRNIKSVVEKIRNSNE